MKVVLETTQDSANTEEKTLVILDRYYRGYAHHIEIQLENPERTIQVDAQELFRALKALLGSE